MPDNDKTERAAKHSLPGDDPKVNTTAGDGGQDASPGNQSDKKDVGKGQGGADASGAGNILAGVQPTNDKDGDTERRHD